MRTERAREGPAPAPPRRVLILKPCCLGDVLLATPLAAALRAAWPEARIDWAVDAHSRPALLGNPHLDDLLDASGCIRGDLRPRRLIATARRLRRGRYDAVFVPDRSPVLGLLARLSGARLRVGLGAGWRARAYTQAVPAPWEPPRHEAELYLDLARVLGLRPPDPVRPVYRPSEDARQAAAGILAAAAAESTVGVAEDLGTSGLPAVATHIQVADLPTADPPGAAGPWVAVHPGGGVNPGMSLLAKRWPAERFAAVAGRLAAECGARILLLGGRGDEDAAAAFTAALPPEARARLLDRSGRADLALAAALVERCALYLGNDSGLAHLAAAVGTPVVVVFGPTRPERYGPLPGCGLAVAPPVGTAAGDALGTMAGSTAIQAVTVAAVWGAVEALWSGPTPVYPPSPPPAASSAARARSSGRTA